MFVHARQITWFACPTRALTDSAHKRNPGTTNQGATSVTRSVPAYTLSSSENSGEKCLRTFLTIDIIYLAVSANSTENTAVRVEVNWQNTVNNHSAPGSIESQQRSPMHGVCGKNCQVQFPPTVNFVS